MRRDRLHLEACGVRNPRLQCDNARLQGDLMGAELALLFAH